MAKGGFPRGMGGGASRAEVGEQVEIHWEPSCAVIVERGAAG